MSETVFIGPVPKRVLKTSLVRLGVVFLCLLSVAMVYWSLTYRLQPANREYQRHSFELSRLTDDVEQLRIKSVTGADEVREKFKTSQDLLFSDVEQIREWQLQLRKSATGLELQARMKVEPAKPYPGLETRLATMEAIIDISAPEEDTNSAYSRLVSFCDALKVPGKRTDLVELTVRGDSNSVQNARAVVRLFTTTNMLTVK
jgi:hypothetical protein